MRIPAISLSINNNTHKNPRKTVQKSRENRNPPTFSFGAKFAKTDLLYQSSIQYHKANIFKIDPFKIEEYFKQQGIPAFFREGSDFAKKMVAYCCYHTSEIFSQLHYKKPVQIGLTGFRRFGHNATGLCHYAPSTYSPTESYPAMSILFNSFVDNQPYNLDGKTIPLNWESFFDISMDSNKKHFLSSGHFLSPFIHEFAHSLHYHKIFSKFGAPFNNSDYVFNPTTQVILDKLNMKLDTTNPYVSSSIIKNIDENISRYGATLLPEAFAEAFTKAVLQNLDIFSLRLTKNPFPMYNNGNKILNQVLYETFEGLVGDGAGLI